jgi:two-component system, OmpR family, sensor histidine kinase MprB
MTLRWRVTLVLAILAAGVGTFAAAASYVTTRSQLRVGIDGTLTVLADAVNGGRGGNGGQGRTDRHDDTGGGVITHSDCPNGSVFQQVAAAQLLFDDGTTTLCIDGGPKLPLPKNTSFASSVVELRTVTLAGQHYRMLSTAWHDGGTLQMARGLDESETLLARLRARLTAYIVLATVVAAGLGYLIARRVARPIVQLRNVAHTVTSTLDFSTAIDVTGSGEVGSLAVSFSSMMAAVARSQDQQRRLISDASHEMRTPLTSLLSNVELLQRGDSLPDAERGEVLDDVRIDVQELASLLAELVDLASDLAAAEPMEQLSLGDLARTVASRTQRRTGRTVSVDEGAAQTVVGRPRQLERAISNLVDNAVKYSATEAPVDVVVDRFCVSVRDRGAGIAAEDADHIFDRFYRSVDARTLPGSGLGLSIVDEIIRSHGGTVYARNRPDGGAEIGFTLVTSDRSR